MIKISLVLFYTSIALFLNGLLYSQMSRQEKCIPSMGSKDSLKVMEITNHVGGIKNGIHVFMVSDTIIKTFQHPKIIAKGKIQSYDMGKIVVADELTKSYVYINDFYDMDLPHDIIGKRILVIRCYHTSYKYKYKIFD